MPDIVLWTSRVGVPHLALAEAKTSTRQDPNRLIEKCVSQFLVDIKTRAHGFSHHYEGYLICAQFCDGGRVLCSCLSVDLSCYAKSHHEVGPQPSIHSKVAPYGLPGERLQGLIRLQAEMASVQDEYLTGLLSEEATRSATLDLIRQESLGTAHASLTQDQVEAYIFDVASKLGLAEQWAAGQDLIRDLKGKEKDHVTKALTRYQKPTLDLD